METSEDQIILDAYSAAVVGAVERVSQSVVKVDVHQETIGTPYGPDHNQGGSGSGVIFYA
jgi:hypothetical protein